MSERQLLLQKFEELPTLVNAALATSPFDFPERNDPPRKTLASPAGADTSVRKKRQGPPISSRPKSGSIANLRDALLLAAEKPQFGHTSLDEWASIMQFAGSTIRRRSKRQVFEVIASPTTEWSDDDPINDSAESSSSWFVNELLYRIKEGAPHRHGHAILGGQGCGKSTLIKYLLSKHAEDVRKRKIVFSRFEFLKFWDDWRDEGSLDAALTSYITFIHLRDLLLDRFFDFVDGREFKRKFRLRTSEQLADEICNVTSEVEEQCRRLDVAFNDQSVRLTIANCVAKADEGNHELMTYIKGLELGERMTLISGFWPERCVVTIFDGLDELHLEDAFQKTDQWVAVRHIIENRRRLSMPARNRGRGMKVETDSIVVMRKSTAAFLEWQTAKDGDLGLRTYYHVLPINSLAGMASVVRRALAELPDFQESPAAELDEYTFKLMKVLQRTMLAIGRSEGGATALEDIYNLFDGNLRDLFKFAASTIDWSCKEMLRSKLLDSQDYFDGAKSLINVLASSRGTDFLRQKSYRVIEQLLLRDGASFENAGAVLTTDSELLEERNTSHVIKANRYHHGQIDNIFNYLNVGEAAHVDAHTFLEKVRIAQLLWDDPLPDPKLKGSMASTFGYVPWNSPTLVKLMMKTGFMAAEVNLRSHKLEILLRSTARAKLCITSLIGNLAYIEHIFHQTLFPSVLISHISDKARTESSTVEWAVASIRNAFIFLTYFRHIEQNAAKGVHVPADYRLAEKARLRVVTSLERMTSILDWPDPPKTQAERVRLNETTAICSGALQEIQATLKAWRSAGATPSARNAA